MDRPSEGDIGFVCAYWEWLRGKTVFEPRAEQYGLSEQYAQVLCRQCDIEHETE